ncbi:MAG: ShlB/FhaC/HecB family hemolysin secretion/activation protein [Bacteroidetes bacterium]|nr:ShlB/FhaC/HecB family hemolysin secretion/activation protein [Bacteroidota bacterium]
MAFFRGWSLARLSQGSGVQSSVFACLFLSIGFSLLIDARAFSSENDSLYAIKVYPDGTSYKVKWENISKTPDDTNLHGGAPRFRAPRAGELERLTEEGDEVESKQPKPGPTAKINQVQVPVPPTKPAAPPPGRLPVMTNPSPIPTERVFRRRPEGSSLPARMGPSLEYGQAYQDYGTDPLRLDPHPPVLSVDEQTSQKTEKAKPFAASLRGLVFLADPTQIQSSGIPDFHGVESRVPFLSKSQAEKIVSPYLNKPVSMKTLGEIRNKVNDWLASTGRMVSTVLVPEQEIRGGVIQILILSGHLGEVRVEGNRYFKSENLRGEIRLRPNEEIGLAELGDDVAWLNANPFRQVQTSLAPGSKAGSTDVVLEVTDRFPFRPYISYDNFGVSTLGYDRYSTGFTLMDVWTGWDQKIDYQYLTSGGFSKLQANSGTWAAALPWRHTATVFGSYSKANPDAVGQLDLSSYFWQVSGRYNILLPTLPFKDNKGDLRHQAYLGFDFKAANSDVFFAGAQLEPSTNGLAGLYNIFQLVFGYTGTMTDPIGSTALELVGFASPGGATGDNSDASFQQINGGATANYVYGKFLLNRVFRLPEGISLVGNLQIQQANHGFFDYGQVLQENSDTTTSVNWHLMSIGPGLRYSIGPYFTARFDWGFQLQQAPPGTTGGVGGRAGTSQAVVSATLAY